MNFKEALVKLEALRGAIEKVRDVSGPHPEEDQNIAEIYGEVEEIVHRFAKDEKIEVPSRYGNVKPNIYPNFIEAGYLSGRNIHQPQGYTQLLKIIGKVRQLDNDPHAPPAPPSVTGLLQTLRRFRECCQYTRDAPADERAVQDILWIMLRSQYDRVDRENALPKFGVKSHRPDFGIPDLQTLIEVKFIGDKTNPGKIQEEILADVPAYLQTTGGTFVAIIELVYDHAHKLLDSRKFEEDLKRVDGIFDVIVVPGIAV